MANHAVVHHLGLFQLNFLSNDGCRVHHPGLHSRKLLDSATCPDGCASRAGFCQQAATPGGLRCVKCNGNLLVDTATGLCGEGLLGLQLC
jgi:hypothetical protein